MLDPGRRQKQKGPCAAYRGLDSDAKMVLNFSLAIFIEFHNGRAAAVAKRKKNNKGNPRPDAAVQWCCS